MMGETISEKMVRRLAALLLLTWVVAQVQAVERPAAPRQTAETTTVTVQQQYQFLRYVPPGYEKDRRKRWPLVLFLHGAGERGADLQIIKRQGLTKVIESGKDFPFVMIAPQCAEDEWWNIATLEALVEQVAKRERIDRDRIYLTGLSMGGFATWALAIRHPERYAAILPICGGGEIQRAWVLRDVPIWTFHGDADDIVPLFRTQDIVDAVKRAGGSPRLTVYPGVGHNAWVKTYEDPEVFEWLLSQRLSNRPHAKMREQDRPSPSPRRP